MQEYNLNRFIKAQADSYEIAYYELSNGKKESHWMWYIFPQIRGLGTSSMSHAYGISGRKEAKEYLKHPMLSERIYELCGELLKHKNKSAEDIFGNVDAMKLRSSMTLFALAGGDGSIFHQVLDHFFDGKPDTETLRLVAEYD